MNLEGNESVSERLFTMFNQKYFISLTSFTVIFDKFKQIVNQYEEFNAFHFIKYVQHVNYVKFITNFNYTLYEHNLSLNMCYLSIQYLEISAFQLVDIQSALNLLTNVCHLTLDLSNNYKLPYKNVNTFVNQLHCLKGSAVQSLHLNLRNMNLSELEFICLYLAVQHVNNVTMFYEIELSNLFRVTDSQTKLFLHHLGETIVDSTLFKNKFELIFARLSRHPYSFTHAAVNFYYNYCLTP